MLVLGKGGQVGWHLQKVLPKAIFWGRQELDLANIELIGPAILKQRPDIIINAAAYTAVDKAESEPDLARTVNALAVKELAVAAQILDIPLLHISTDYVFSGKSNKPYQENDPTGPASIYGKTKLEGEQAVKEHCDKYWIIRTSWVFSEHGSNFVKTMLLLGKERQNLSIVADQKGCPTYAGDIAETIKVMVDSPGDRGLLPWGVYHFAGKGVVSWFEFAVEVFDRAYKDKLLVQKPVVDRISTSAYPQPAPRPDNSCLDTSKLESWLGQTVPEWRDALSHVIRSV